jgi:hypothetical protein
MPLGPKRAPGRYDVPVSKGAPAELSDTKISCGLSILTDECNVVFRMRVQARAVRQAAEGGDSGEHRVGLCKGQLLFMR